MKEITPQSSGSGPYLRGYICTIWDLGLAAHYIIIPARPGSWHQLGHCHPCHGRCDWGGGGYLELIPPKLWSHSTCGDNNLICAHWANSGIRDGGDQSLGPVLYYEHCHVTLFCAEDTRGWSKGAAAWYYSNCLQLYQPWGGTNISTVIRTHFIS